MQYLYSQNPSKQLCFALFSFVSSFVAHRIVSCLGNLICNSPKDNLIRVSLTYNDKRSYSNSSGCYYFSRFVVRMIVFVLMSFAT